jgi:hypothetical protein
MYICKSRFLTRGEVWYDDEVAETGSVDWIIYYQRSQPVRGTRWEYFYTYGIDLTEPAEKLETQLNEDTAYKIRRARERDRIVCEACDSRDSAVLDHFEEMYNQFAATKGLSPLERRRVDSMAAAGRLDLSAAKDSQGNVLVYHGSYCDHRRATQLYLPSLYRNFSDNATRSLIGRANRFLTWSDILRFKDRGLKSFDFGGWYAGSDPAMLKINNFKKGFGGQVLREYRCEQVLTLKAWVVFKAAKLVKQVKLSFSAPQKPSARSLSVKAGKPTAVASA